MKLKLSELKLKIFESKIIKLYWLKSYLIYGILFGVCVVVISAVIVALLQSSWSEGVKQLSFLNIVLLSIGGIFIGYIRDIIGLEKSSK